jgi:hypothetical protein
MDREVVAILLADLLVLTAVLATAVQPLLAEMRLLLRLLLKPVRLIQESGRRCAWIGGWRSSCCGIGCWGCRRR